MGKIVFAWVSIEVNLCHVIWDFCSGTSTVMHHWAQFFSWDIIIWLSLTSINVLTSECNPRKHASLNEETFPHQSLKKKKENEEKKSDRERGNRKKQPEKNKTRSLLPQIPNGKLQQVSSLKAHIRQAISNPSEVQLMRRIFWEK